MIWPNNFNFISKTLNYFKQNNITKTATILDQKWHNNLLGYIGYVRFLVVVKETFTTTA